MIVRTTKFIEPSGTNYKEHENNLFDYQKNGSNNYVVNEKLVHKFKLELVKEPDEADTRKKEDDVSPLPRRAVRTTKGSPSRI